MSDIRPAATVILVRDTRQGIDTLLLRRSSTMGFAAGAWVFPGGRIDPVEQQRTDDPVEAARMAAVRETREEAELTLTAAELRYYAHWTTPPIWPKRYATWFFVARAPEDNAVTVDGGEIDDHVWIRPGIALERHAAGDIEMMPPTFVTLTELTVCRDVDEVLSRAAQRTAPVFEPHFISREHRPTEVLYFGDAGYDLSDPELPGSRHRLVMARGGWRYLNDAIVPW